MKRWTIISILTCAGFFVGCAPQTSRVKTDSDYRPVKPPKSRLVVESDMSRASGQPMVALTVYEEVLANKVLTQHYTTKYPGKKAAEVAGGVALAGAATGLFIAAGKTSSQDTSARSLYYIGGIAAGLGSLYLVIKQTPSDDWARDSVLHLDTIYSFRKPLSSALVGLQSDESTKKSAIRTDGQGKMMIDIRDITAQNRINRDLEVTLSYMNATPTVITIPSAYVSAVMKNEVDANQLLSQAQSSATRRKFLDASKLYNQLVEEYARTHAATTARSELELYTEEVKQERISEGRRQLRAVSMDKVSRELDGAGITAADLNELGWRLDNLSATQLGRIFNEGLDMPLDQSAVVEEYQSLNNSQKIYTILAAAEKLGRKQGSSPTQILTELTRINDALVRKLVQVESKTLLTW